MENETVKDDYEAPEFVLIDLVDSIGDICGSGGGGTTTGDGPA